MFLDIFNAYRDFIVLVLATVLLVILLVRYWDRVSLWWLNVLYSFPLIGKISRTKKDFRLDTQNRWYQSERSLFSDYSKFIKVKDKRGYLECKNYLQKAQDHGRTPLPIFIWTLIVLMVFVEAMGFSYVLAGMAVPGASEAILQQVTYGIAFLIAVILVALTHFAGHELNRNEIIKRALSEWQVANARGDAYELGTKVSSLDVTINDETKSQNDDDDAPRYAQTIERVGATTTYRSTILTAVIVTVVAIGATYVRIQILDKQMAEETALDATGPGEFYDAPPEVAIPAEKADNKAINDIIISMKHAGWGTYIILAVVFIFLQILGVIFGMTWGFAGKESKNAFNISGGKRFDTYQDFKAYTYDRIADEANNKHNQLRTKMQKVALKKGITIRFNNLSFADFMEDKVNEQRRTDELHPVSKKPRFHYADAQNQATADTYALTDLRDLLNEGVVHMNTNVFEVGGEKWKPLSEFIKQADVPPPPPVVNIPPPPLTQVKPNSGDEKQQ